MDNNQFSGNSSNNWETPLNQSTVSLNEGYVAKYIAKVYGWMFLGLAITAVVAGFIAMNDTLVLQVARFSTIVFIGQLVLVGYFAIRVPKMSSATATAVFLGYAALNGLTFALLLRMFPPSVLISVFGITSGTFAVMSAVGYFTKQDLTSFGRIMMMGLVGVIIASIVNLFLSSPMLYWIISYVGVAVFVGLIAYDTQKIKGYAYLDSEEARKKGAILGALSLYLDFINLFIMLLRLFGGRR
jgi:FtsH-binding integral membrane protein